MVLEHLFPESWIEKKFWSSLTLGALYSFIGIILAYFIFRSNMGIASVMFTAILLIPSLEKLFRKEERIEEKEKKFSLKELYKDNKHLILAYSGIFIGVFVMHYFMSFFLTYAGFNTIKIFGEQYALGGISGHAIVEGGLFWSILQNNWWVLLACFLLSLISGDGATFFVIWNASSWATIFGYRALAIAYNLGLNPFVVMTKLQLIVTPHIILEGLAYILAGIAGAVISDDIISESSELSTFVLSFIGAAIGFVVIRMILKTFMSGWVLVSTNIILVFVLLRLLSYSFIDKKHKEVFTYNYYLFLLAVLIFLLGALVETFVLSSSNTLHLFYGALA